MKRRMSGSQCDDGAIEVGSCERLESKLTSESQGSRRDDWFGKNGREVIIYFRVAYLVCKP